MLRVEISAHYLCAEDHLPYQGRQFSQKEFDALQARLDRPFGMWNCKHTIFPIILGVSEPAHSDRELEEINRNSSRRIDIGDRALPRYEWTQEQRKLETAVRAQKDIANLAKASGDDVARREAQAKISALMDRYDRITEAAGLETDYKRMYVAGFRQVKAEEPLKSQTEYDTIKSYEEMMANRRVLKNSELKNGLAIKSDANSIADMVDNSGNVLQRRVYRKDGRAATDFDTGDHTRPDTHPTGAHKHIFDYSRKRARGVNIPLTEADSRRNTDIIKRGENYFDPK